MENYEQKYKEALKVIEGLYNVVKYQSSSDALLTFQTLEKAFPELKESEDERIRKALVEWFYGNIKSGIVYGLGFSNEEIIAWLEKQGEQKPAWSEEDERLLNNMVIVIQDYYNKEDAQSLISWLKSLKPNHWKPSEEQMEALKKECIAHSNYQLCRLLEELEKL